MSKFLSQVTPPRVVLFLAVANHVLVFALAVLNHYDLPQVIAMFGEVAGVTQAARKYLEGYSNWEQVITAAENASAYQK